jgi:asparagine synthase (glutamine-hydrolysing)
MVGMAGFLDNGGPHTSSLSLNRMGELLGEGPKIRLSQPFLDGDVCCISASLSFRGLQPYIAADLAVWFDGEIYDFGEFKTDINNAHESTHESTTAIVAALYRRHGLTWLKKIDGNFAAMIYDKARMQLHLMNDRYGLRRLYIWKGGNLVWASTLRSFLSAPGFTPRLDPMAVDEFFDFGYITEDRTWFKEVTLLPSGSILTWDIRANAGKVTRYWWWNEIKLLGGRLNENEVADELAYLFVRAVERRVRPGERIGLELSGGLDSRAILAAMPDHGKVVNTFTFGVEGCADRVIAARAAAVRGAAIHQFSLDETNWLLPRFRGVWFTDGQSSLMHMHGIEAAEVESALCDIVLNGFLGDGVLRGSYLFEGALDCPITADLVSQRTGRDQNKINIPSQYHGLMKTDFYFLQNRARRWLYNGELMMSNDIQLRTPFSDNALLEFTYSLPDSLRFDGRLYRKMLLRRFPVFYRRIPWQATGYPIGLPENIQKLLYLTRRARRKFSRLSGGLFHDPFKLTNYADYNAWLRRDPARSIFAALLNNPKAIYSDYLPKSLVQQRWIEHLGGMDHAEIICLYATFEVWLQQAFENRLRSEVDVQSLWDSAAHISQ